MIRIRLKRDDVWLNEALATFLTYKFASVFTEWDYENQFIDNELLQTMWEDGFPSSTPIKVEVLHPEDFYRLYDPIKNSKGAAIIRMLESFIDPNDLKNYMRVYVNSKKFGPATEQDFYNSITMPAELGVSAKDYLERWVLQKNYPEVAVLMSVVNGRTRVSFIQDRFLLTEIQEENPFEIESPWK